MSDQTVSQHPKHPHADHPIFSRKFTIIAALAILVVFLATVVFYPLIFSSEKNSAVTEPLNPPSMAPIAPVNPSSPAPPTH